jgi:aryl-phospho-beta-D-glucosidase BglC (GH1 family)
MILQNPFGKVSQSDKMVALWKKLVLRYKDNPWLVGIINEPNWNFTGKNINAVMKLLNVPQESCKLELQSH